eukprot:1900708-Rhodomonas_salina.2
MRQGKSVLRDGRRRGWEGSKVNPAEGWVGSGGVPCDDGCTHSPRFSDAGWVKEGAVAICFDVAARDSVAEDDASGKTVAVALIGVVQTQRAENTAQASGWCGGMEQGRLR